MYLASNDGLSPQAYSASIVPQDYRIAGRKLTQGMALPLQVRKNDRTRDVVCREWPICVARPAKNADLLHNGPGPGTEIGRTCTTQ